MVEITLPDTSLTLLEAVQHNEIHNAHYPLFLYEDADGIVQTITWGQTGRACTIAGRIVREGVGAKGKLETDNGHPKVVGIVANLDSMSFYSLVVGIMRAGFTPFPISIRNSPEGIAHLMAATGCNILVSTDDAVTHQLAVASIKSFEEDGPVKRSAMMIPAPYFEQLYGSEVSDNLAAKLPNERKDIDKSAVPCVISHSSGTTSFPKPIILTNRMINQHSTRNRREVESHFRCRSLSIHALPMYHMMGISMIPWSAMLGLTLSVIRPRKPPIQPSPDFVLRSAIVTSSSMIFCAPTFLEAWASEASNIEALKTFDPIMYGGGPIQDDVAENLVKQGAKLLPLLGLSETGVITTFYPKHIQTEGASWYEADTSIDVVFIPEDEKLKGVYRLAVRENTVRQPASFDTMVDGMPAFDTKDLVMMHPTNPKLWKIVGRADDQITHSTGEKTNPVPIEALLEKSPYISAALMFGRARLQPGVIITPYKDYVFDISDNPKRRVDDYLNLVWDTITSANQNSPQHSRIFKEMILIADPQKPFEYTGKGTIRRKITLDKYEKEIEQLYEVTETSSGSADIEKPASLSPADITTFIRLAVHKILEHEVGDDSDIFRVGADSLCALSIRVAITRGLHQSGQVSRSATDNLPRDLVYMYPTISMMAEFISGPFLTDSASQPHSNKPSNGLAADLIAEDLTWQSILQTKETVVKIVPGHGEPPLIIIHGGAGKADFLRAMLKFTTAIWGIQRIKEFTSDVPIEVVAAFYFEEIKEKQPHGPYRLAAFSGSSVILMELVSIFERNGDEVAQFAMLDHSPAIFFPGLKASNVQIDDPKWMTQYARDSVHQLANLLLPATRSRLTSNNVLARRNKEMMDGLNGTLVNPGSLRLLERVSTLQTTSLKYLMKEEFFTVDENGNRAWSLELCRKFMARIKAPLTVYVASEGVKVIIPDEMEEEKKDLGARMLFPNARLVPIEGDHIGFLEEEALHSSLQEDYLVR